MMLWLVLYLLTLVVVNGIALPGRLHHLMPVTTITLEPENMVATEHNPWFDEAFLEIKRALSFWPKSYSHLRQLQTLSSEGIHNQTR